MAGTERLAILGGGVAGVVLANELSTRSHFEIDIIEKTTRLGGLQRSVEIDGAVYDIGSFVFDPGHELLRTFPFLYDTFVQVPHLSLAITPHGTIDRYPMTLRGYLRDNGAVNFLHASLDLLLGKIVHRKRDTLISFIKYYLGNSVYVRSGLKSYIERFYCTSDNDVDLEFARQRLLPLRNECALRRNLGRILSQAADFDAEQKPWTCYVRPHRGFDAVYHDVRKSLEEHGVRITTGATIEGIRTIGDGFEVVVDGEVRRYDRVISTIPVPVMSAYMGLPDCDLLPTMTLISLFYRFDGDPGFSSGFLYNFTHDGDWKRITLFSNYYGPHRGEHYFVAECTVRYANEGSIERHRESFERHIATLSIFRGALKYQGGLITENAYPLYRKGDLDRIRRAKDRLVDAGIDIAGRQGGFDYLTSHATAASSKMVARGIIETNDVRVSG